MPDKPWTMGYLRLVGYSTSKQHGRDPLASILYQFLHSLPTEVGAIFVQAAGPSKHPRQAIPEFNRSSLALVLSWLTANLPPALRNTHSSVNNACAFSTGGSGGLSMVIPVRMLGRYEDVFERLNHCLRSPTRMIRIVDVQCKRHTDIIIPASD
jgi:hypothetical protein